MKLKETMDIVFAELNLPIAEDFYAKDAAEYITVNYEDERPGLRADDEDLTNEIYVQVHHYFTGSPTVSKKTIRKMLRKSGFAIKNSTQFYERETKKTHIVISAWIDEINTDMEEN